MKKTICCSLLINILLVCFFLLINTLAFSIPQGWMEDNVRQSEKEFQVMEIPTIYDSSYTNEVNYAAWIGMAYRTDSCHTPFFNGINMMTTAEGHNFGVDNISSALQKEDIGYSYSRYWHGAVATLRFLLLFGSYHKILTVSSVLLCLLFIFSAFLVWRKDKIMSILFVISILASTFHTVIQSCYYMVDYYVFFIIIIITMVYFINKSWHPFICFLAFSGALTSYYDGLVVPVLMIGYPLVLYVVINKKYDLKQIVVASIVWALSYAFCLAMKWVLAKIVCDVNIFSYLNEGYNEQYNLHIPWFQTLKRLSFFPMSFVMFIFALLYFLFVKKIKIDIYQLICFLIIATIPVAFCIVDWYPFIFHYWMTHRNWSVSYFAFMSCLYVMAKQSNRTET